MKNGIVQTHFKCHSSIIPFIEREITKLTHKHVGICYIYSNVNVYISLYPISIYILHFSELRTK